MRIIETGAPAGEFEALAETIISTPQKAVAAHVPATPGTATRVRPPITWDDRL